MGKVVCSGPRMQAAGPNGTLEGSVLITGGLGALGLLTARWLVAQGARSLVLVSKRLPFLVESGMP